VIPSLSELRIDWGCTLTQIPKVIPTINLGSRLVVFGLLEHGMISEKLILSGMNDSHQPLKWAIPVTERKGNTIHKMAAYTLITELYENESTNKSQIIQLGLKHQLATKFTSFVATAVNENTAAGDTMKSQNITLQKPAPVKEKKETKKDKQASKPTPAMPMPKSTPTPPPPVPQSSAISAYLDADDEEDTTPANIYYASAMSAPISALKNRDAGVSLITKKKKEKCARYER